jgi:hypothetical protein
MELATIISGSCLSISAELFIGPARHQPLADDWSIPPEHLRSFEHSSISLFFLIYASVALYAGFSKLTVPPGALQVIAALPFSQELLLFHLHSADHIGLEGHYHWLLELIVVISLSTTLLEVPFPQSFLVATVRSASWVFHGAWFIHMGFMLWIPAFIAKGCQKERSEGHDVFKCASQEATMRAKALANLQFNWYLATILVLMVIFYARTVRIYADEAAYQPLQRKPAIEGDKKADTAVEMGSHGVERQYFCDGSQSPIYLESLQKALEFEI